MSEKIDIPANPDEIMNMVAQPEEYSGCVQTKHISDQPVMPRTFEPKGY